MEPLTIPIEADVAGVDQGIDKVDAALGKLEGQLESVGKAGQKSGTDAARGLRRIGTEAQKQEGGLAALERRFDAFQKRGAGAAGGALAGSLGNLMEQLAGEARELARGTDDATQSLVQMGASALPSMGPIGAALAALVGGMGLVTRAEREQQEEMARTAQLHDAAARLGPMYANIASSIDASATAEQRLAQTIAAAQGLLREQAGLLTRGFSPEQVRTFTATVDAAVPAIRTLNGGVQSHIQSAEVMAAVTARNSGQFRQWGLSVKFGTDEVENQMIAMRALNELRIRNARQEIDLARQRLAGARAENEVTQRQTASLLSGYYGRERLAERQRASREAVTAATAALTRAEMELQAAQGATARIASTIADHEREIAEQRDLRGKRERTASASNTASMMERLAATRAMAEAEYNLSRARVQLGAGDAAQRFEVENALRREAIRHTRDLIALAEEDAARGRQRGENAVQTRTRQAQAVERVATLTRELAEAEATEAQRAREAYIDIGTQLAEGSRARAVVDLTRRTEELGDATAREAAASAGRYRSTVERVAQLDRESAARRQLIADLHAHDEVIGRIADQQTRETEAAANRARIRTLESAEQTASTQRAQLQITQLQSLRDHFVALADQSTGASDVVVRSFDAMTGAIGSNVAAFALGEQTFAQATQAMVAETTKAITEIAAKEMVLNVARGTAALFTNPPAAAAHFGAAAIYAGLAAGAGALSSATRPAEASAGGGAREPTSVGPRATDSAGGGTVEVVQYYGPVIDGRASTEDQVGQRVNRYQRAGAMRLERQT